MGSALDGLLPKGQVRAKEPSMWFNNPMICYGDSYLIVYDNQK
jgi:hypothetical protein